MPEFLATLVIPFVARLSLSLFLCSLGIDFSSVAADVISPNSHAPSLTSYSQTIELSSRQDEAHASIAVALGNLHSNCE